MSLNINELVQKLQQQQLLKRDMVVPSSCLFYSGGKLQIRNVSENPAMDELLNSSGITTGEGGKTTLVLDPMDAFNKQLAAKFDIPFPYYKKLLEEKNVPLLDSNINHWFSTIRKNYLVRCFANPEGTGVVRAILGDRYRILDNLDVLMAALDAVRQTGVNIKIESADITDTKMYVRFIAPDVVLDSPKLLQNYRVPNREQGNDYGIHSGFILTNSETGHGSSFVAPRLVVRACSNGMIMKQDATNKVHLGGKMDEGRIDWSEETKNKNIELIIAQVKDAVKHYTSPEYLGQTIDKLEGNGTTPLENPVDAIANISRELNFGEQKQKDLLAYFMQSSDLTGFGAAQAVTYFAHAKSDADERFELEAMAVDIVSNIKQFDKPAVQKRTSQKGFGKN